MTNSEDSNATDSPELNELRNQIANIDTELARLICRRLDLARIAGEMKHTNGIPIQAPEVEKQNMERVKGMFRELNQDEEAAEGIWKEIMMWSLEAQKTWF